MEQLINWINTTGEHFTTFAWSMLIQSSVLILFIFLVDRILQKRVRAIVRYCLWLLVLVKLMLPTTLATPLSVGEIAGDKLASIQPKQINAPIETQPNNSIRKSEPQSARIKPSSVPAHAVPKSTSASTPVHNAPESTRASVPPGCTISLPGALFAGWIAIVTTMLLLLIQRAWFVSGLVRQSTPANNPMKESLEICKQQLNIRKNVELRVSPNATSPAICGLFHPVILVPPTLGKELGAHAFRAVLMHELVHLKRGDLWFNLIQTLLQIAYFYNPLLWFANAILRRVREQAVDEAVQVAMGPHAERYPETLLNVAKLAFGRPALSLRLIGVVENKNALTKRIHRMLNRPVPKNAKLGLSGIVALLITAAIFLPMAKANNNKPDSAAANTENSTFITTLSTGVTVELVGICEKSGEEKKWWKPDGTLIDNAPYKENHVSIGSMMTSKSFEAAVKITGAKQQIGFRFDVKDTQNSGSSGTNNPYMYCIAFDQPKNKTQTSSKIGIASGKWQTEQTQKPDFSGVYGYQSTTWHGPIESNGQTILTMNHNLTQLNTRVVAIDREGKTHVGGSHSRTQDSVESVQTTFKLPLSEIKEFQFQTRPYEWVTFKNVSLKPNVKTNVLVEVASAFDPDKSQSLAQEGWNLWKQRKLSEAEQVFQQAIQMDPGNQNACNGLGWSQLNQGKREQAKASFEQCVSLNPDHAAALNGLGWIAKGQGQTEQAIEYWQKAIKAAPSATAAMSGLADVYTEQKQYELAKKMYEKILAVQPHDQNAKQRLQQLDREQTQQDTGENSRQKSLNNELLLAAQAGHYEIAKMLLEKGADINTTDKYNSTPLIIAIIHNHDKLFEFLLSKGADVNVADKDGATPLHASTGMGNLKITKQLIEHGANPNAANKYGLTPLAVALASKHTEVAEYLAGLKDTGKISMQAQMQMETTSTPQQTPANQQENKLIAYWDFEGNAKDKIGNYDGIVQGALPTDGIKGKAYVLDGEDDYIQTSLKLDQSGRKDYTISLWVYPTRAKSSNIGQHVISTDNGEFDWSVCCRNTKWYVFTGTNRHCTNLSVDVDKWQHLAVVFDCGNNNTTFYKNGIRCPITFPLGTDASTNTLCFGDNPGPWEAYFKGIIDEAAVYEGVLSPEEIKRIAHQHVTTENITSKLSQQPPETVHK